MELDTADIVLLMGAAFIAVTVMVRMMARRRDKLLDDLSNDAHQQQKRKAS